MLRKVLIDPVIKYGDPVVPAKEGTQRRLRERSVNMFGCWINSRIAWSLTQYLCAFAGNSAPKAAPNMR
jgi:hypothetical protein